MSTQDVTDELIRSSIARRTAAAAEGDLRGRILAATAARPQRQGWLARLDGWQLVPQRTFALRLTVMLVVLATLAVLAALAGHRADRTAPAPFGGLVYISHGDLYVAGPVGESPRLVWDSTGTEDLSRPMWVDAETILVGVHEAADAVDRIYLVDIASGARRLVAYSSVLLALSADHRRIATAYTTIGRSSRLRIVDLPADSIVVDSGGGHLDGGVDVGEMENRTPLSWSPDGRWLIGEGSRYGSGNLIYRIDLDSKLLSQTFNDLATGLCCNLHQPRPVLSPDGSLVAFVNYHDAVKGEICDFRCGTLWALDPTTGARQQLTAEEGSEIGPAFSPDGEWIAFMEWVGTGYDVAVVRADGTGRRTLTDSGDAYAPAANLEPYKYLYWDPDGTGLTFMRGPSGLAEWQLWHVAIAGLQLQRVGTITASEFAR
jgi:Tol biopolymer transport system component